MTTTTQPTFSSRVRGVIRVFSSVSSFDDRGTYLSVLSTTVGERHRGLSTGVQTPTGERFFVFVQCRSGLRWF